VLFAQQLGTAWRWPKTKIEYNDQSMPLFTGRHANVAAADADSAWEITKTIYNGLGLETASETRIGAWSNRAALGWGI
jgi:hypothetical protein